MSEAPMGPVPCEKCGRPAPCEKPRQFQDHWWGFLDNLPSQVRHPLRDALNPKLSAGRRRAGLHHANCALQEYRVNAATYSDSVSEMLIARGMENVDPVDAKKAAAFLDRITDSGLKAIEKRKRAEAAIAFADMTIAWLNWQLGHGN